MNKTFLAKIVDGNINFQSPFNEARFREFCKNNEGKIVRVELPKSFRSGQQNRYYWLYLGIISMETGNDEMSLHEFFKFSLLPKKTVIIKGKKKDHILETTKSTTELSKLEMGDYLDKICAMTDVPLPDPILAGYVTNY